MLNNAEPCRRALCSCCVRRTMKDSPSDSWLHLAGSITLSLSFSLSLLLPSLLCGPEWQGDSRLGISQSLPSSSVPSACQPARLLIPGRDGTLPGKKKKRGRRGQQWRQSGLTGGSREKLTEGEPRSGSRAEGRRRWASARTAGLDRGRRRHTTAQFGELKITDLSLSMNFRLL